MIQTSGKWDSSKRPLYFINGDPTSLEVAGNQHPYIMLTLESLGKDPRGTLRRWIEEGRCVLLDSGLYTLVRKYARTRKFSEAQRRKLGPAEVPGFERLEERYREVINTYRDYLWGFMEVDHGEWPVRDGRNAAWIESGLVPIPVYRPFSDPPETLDCLLKQYDRVAIGGLVDPSPEARKRLIATLWETHRRFPKNWFHFLGYTPDATGLAYPFDSCDSSAALNGVKYGQTEARAMGVPFTSLPPGMTYDQRADKSSGKGYRKAWQAAGYVAALEQRNRINVEQAHRRMGWLPYI